MGTSVAFALIVATLFGFLLVFLANTIGESTIPFDRDETQHAIDGWEVYLAAKHASWEEQDWAIRNQAFYPPVNSFFVAAGYFILGPSVASGRLVTLVLFVGAVLMLAILTYKKSYSIFKEHERARAASLIGAVFAALLAIASEPFVLHGTVVMLETSGVFLVLCLFFLLGKQSNRSLVESNAVKLAVALGIFLVFLTKYSFGFFAPALMLTILSKTKEDYRNRAHWKSVIVITSIVVFFVMLWILLLYDRQSFFGFFTGHPSDAPIFSLENLFYYPNKWLNTYSPSPTWGIIVLTLSAVSVRNYWKTTVVRMAFWSVILAIILFTISTTNVTRHILVAIPLIWFLAGLGLSHLIISAPIQQKNILVLPVLLTFVLMSFALETSDFFSRLPQNVARYFAGKPVYSQLEDFIVDSVEFSQPVALYGDYGDRHGLEALRWRVGVSTEESLWNLHIDRIPLNIREGKIDRANRKSQLSDGNPNQLKSSLLDVVESGYYSYIVEEIQLDEDRTFSAYELDPSLTQYLFASTEIDGWQINIYKFGD